MERQNLLSIVHYLIANSIACAPGYFTKLLKPVFAKLRQMEHTYIGYIDDSLLVSDTKEQCGVNVKDTVHVMEGVGFLIKSICANSYTEYCFFGVIELILKT